MRDNARRFLLGTAGASGVERALLVTVALAIIVSVGHLVSRGADQAGRDAHRVLSTQSGQPGAIQAVDPLRAHDEGGEEVAPSAPAAVAAVPSAAAITAPAAQPPAPAAVASPSPREQFLTDYGAWLDQRMVEVNALAGDARATRVEGLLIQMRDVSAQLSRGEVPDLAGLQTAPAPQETGQAVASTFLPPSLIPKARRLIQVVERPITGATNNESAVLGGSLYSANDWNALLGVPQYRTQSDNLAGPEVTCNVTSMAMILERLGYGRHDVMSAIDRALKVRYLREQGQNPDQTDLSTVTLPQNYERNLLLGYLRENNADSQNYRRLRGAATTDAQRTQIANQYRDVAQMEDALDFLLHIKGISRYEVAVRANDIFRAIEPNPDLRPTAEIITPGPRQTWADARRTVQAAIDEGGGAMLSLYHKGAGQTGTHLVSMQGLTPTGVIVDDPYGRMRPTYNRNQTGDAYADPGRTRANSPYKNQVLPRDSDGDGFDDDWKLGPSQDFVDNESRGNSAEVSDTVLSRAWNRITIYRRPARPQPRPAT